MGGGGGGGGKRIEFETGCVDVVAGKDEDTAASVGLTGIGTEVATAIVAVASAGGKT